MDGCQSVWCLEKDLPDDGWCLPHQVAETGVKGWGAMQCEHLALPCQLLPQGPKKFPRIIPCIPYALLQEAAPCFVTWHMRKNAVHRAASGAQQAFGCSKQAALASLHMYNRSSQGSAGAGEVGITHHCCRCLHSSDECWVVGHPQVSSEPQQNCVKRAGRQRAGALLSSGR